MRTVEHQSNSKGGKIYTKDGKKIIINDVTHLSTPDATEYSFQFVQSMPDTEKFTNIESVLDTGEEYDKVNLRGKVFQFQENHMVSKNLHLVSAILADQTATIPIDIWEPHVSTIKEDNAYSFIALTVRVWNGKKKVSLGKQGKAFASNESAITSITEDQIEKPVGDEVGTISIENILSISIVEIFLVVSKAKGSLFK